MATLRIVLIFLQRPSLFGTLGHGEHRKGVLMADPVPRRPPPAKGSAGTVFGLVAFVGIMAALPVILSERHKRLTGGVPMINSDKPLTPAQVRRGPYLNTGSKDAGADPDWDMKTFTYKGKKPAIVDEGKA